MLLYPEKRKDSVVEASFHAIDRWCERINPKLDKNNEKDREQAARELVSSFKKDATFGELQDSGRRLYTYKKTRTVNGRKIVETVSIVVETDGKEIVTCWINEDEDKKSLFQEEISRWERQQRQRLWGRLYTT